MTRSLESKHPWLFDHAGKHLAKMSIEPNKFYSLASMLLQEKAKRQEEYYSRIRNLKEFLKGNSGEVIEGLYPLGLALTGLQRLPLTSDIQNRESYWLTEDRVITPNPNWKVAWIVEINPNK